MRYIISLLLLTTTLSAQTKWRQIERSLTKWQVPAAYDSIPGVTGYASKYITLQTLIDTLGITSGITGSSDDGNVAYWLADTLTGDTAHYWDRSNKRLGLNTKTPQSLLHVRKNEFALPVAEFDNPGTNGKTVVIKHGANTDGRYPLQITTPAGSSYFDARGYLGLGVSPSYPLHVKNSSGISRFENTNSNGDAGFDLYHSSKWWRIAMNAEGGTTNNVHFRDITGSRYPLTLQSSNGYVGVLNITPGRELDVTGRVRVSTLDTDGSAPTTNGTTKMVITDGNGDLSFTNIPTSPIDSTSIIGGWGIEAVESPANTWNLVADTTQVATQYDLLQKNTDLTLSGTTTVTINSSTGSDVTLTQGSGVTFTRSGNDLTIASTGGGGGIDSTSLVGGWGVNVSESPANTWNVSADTAEVATQYDLTLKQDKLTLTTTGTSGAATLVGSTLNVPQYQAALTSGTNIKTVNGNSLLGSGNVSVGTVTSVGITNGGGLTVSGSPVTGSGSITLTATDQSTSNELQALSYNAGLRQMTIGSGGGTPNTVTIPLPSTSSPGLVPTLPTSGAASLYLDGLGNFTAPSAAAATNLTYTGTASPITLNSSTGSDVTITAGAGITLSGTASNMTITSSASNPGFSYGFLANYTPPSPNNYVHTVVPVTLSPGGSTITFTGGDGLEMTRYASNYAGYKLNQSYGQLLRTTNVGVAITATDTKVDFTGVFENGNMTASTTNDNITLTQAGFYDVEFSCTLYTTGTSNRRVYITLYNGTTAQPSIIEMIQDVDELKYESVSKSRIFNNTAGDQISIQIKYDNAIGDGADIYYRYPSLKITRVK